MQPAHPPPPEPIARQLRQEAGFGCCRCGHPIFQYHHIIPYANDAHFRPEDMMILCPNCHDMATKNAMTIQEQRHYKARPYNIRRGFAAGFLKINDKELRVNMGSNLFIGGGAIIQVDGEPLVGLGLNERGGVDLDVKLYDEQDRPVLSIEDNEWLSGDPTPWDISASYQKLMIRKRRGAISLAIDVRKSPIQLRAEFWRSGHLVAIFPSAIKVDRKPMVLTIRKSTFIRRGLSLRTKPEFELGIGSSVDAPK